MDTQGQFDSDTISEDDVVQQNARKRSSRACDQCRKCKSKCERTPGAPEGTPCKTCSASGTPCTFLGPSYKRGPPKGYIHAIEQRWHQVESMLGVILQSSNPSAKDLVAKLREDELAREILDRVDLGPYGPSGRMKTEDATKEDFFASILRSHQPVTPRDPSRAKRQSRVSREAVSSTQDRGLSIAPSKEWQDQLASRLDSSTATSNTPSTSTTHDSFGEPLLQRRRLDTPDSCVNTSTWKGSPVYTMDAEERDPMDDPTEALGELSLDEQRELRFHGRSSGLHLINTRIDDRNEGGIWRLPMARVWPYSEESARRIMVNDNALVDLPQPAVQEELLQLYFTYVHPTFPVVNKSRFLSEYETFKKSGFSFHTESPDLGSNSAPKFTQKVTPLLLFSMFAVAARYCPMEEVPREGSMWEGGSQYMDEATSLLTKIFHRSRPSTVQSLLLLGYREFGIGSMEQAWIYIGMAIRMALDLGLNCDSGSWKIDGFHVFSPEGTQTRRQIWWLCNICDRYGSMYMGRPVTIKDSDADVPLPHIDQDEERSLWQPLPREGGSPYLPIPCYTMSTLSAVGLLGLILGDLITYIYPVRPIPGVSRRAKAQEFERRLDGWYLSLPEYLQYDLSSHKGQTPPPNILMMHTRYWGVVLLLHRAFIPNWDRQRPPSESTVSEHKVFDLAQSAASRMTTIITTFRETYSLKFASPFLTSYLLSAGIMHNVTLSMHPDHPQATKGLEQTIISLSEMKMVWPSAARALELIKGARASTPAAKLEPISPERTSQKRQAETAFGNDCPSYGNFLAPAQPSLQYHTEPTNVGIQDLNTRIMAQMLGLDIPSVPSATSTAFLPGYGYDLWPPSSTSEPQSATTSSPQASSSWPAATGSSSFPSNPYNVFGM